MAVDGAGNVYVAELGASRVRKITPDGIVSTLAGSAGNPGSADGVGRAAQFSGPRGIAVDGAGNIYVADTGNNQIRMGQPVAVPSIVTGPTLGFTASGFGFNVIGWEGDGLVIEASTDLTHWLPISTNSPAGSLTFGDPQSGVYSARFYRARTP